MLNSSFHPGQIWSDDHGAIINAHGGGMLCFEGVYYWFGEHKTEGKEGNLAQVGVHVYSSRDLYNWHNEGIALAVSNDPQSPIARGCILERPKVVFNAQTGRFVMWFHLEPKGAGYHGAMSGGAVADRVAGPYTFVSSIRPNAGVWPLNAPSSHRKSLSISAVDRLSRMDLPGAPRPYYPRHQIFRRDFANGQMARDMTLFVDDDGSAYHIYASEENGTLHISRLSDDFLKPAGQYVRIFPGRFHEAPTMMKWRSRYFLITSDCTGWAPNTARISTASSIWGPWRELGNPCMGTGMQIASTFQSQSTFILPVQGINDAFIFMADRWNPSNAIDGRYVWLPVEFHHDVPMISWHDEWDLSVFTL
jgi:beta-xylosidase